MASDQRTPTTPDPGAAAAARPDGTDLRSQRDTAGGRDPDRCEAVTVVLVHWNQSESCLRSIEAFLASSIVPSVLVVDNGSDERHLVNLRRGVEAIAARVRSSVHDPSGDDGATAGGPPLVEVLETGRNLGFGPGANAGLSLLLADPRRGPWFVVAPHDVDPAHDCLESMLRSAREHPMAGLLCADVGDGMVPVIDPYFGGMTVPADPQGADTGVAGGGTGWEHVDYPHGTLMMASRRCLEEIGLFDERYFSYCEEAELALRATDAGFEIGLVRGARVTNTHIGSAVATVDYLQTRNTLLLVEENSGRYHAFIRLCIAAGQIVRGLVDESSRPLIFDARARVLGIRDYLRRRFGPPPPGIGR